MKNLIIYLLPLCFICFSGCGKSAPEAEIVSIKYVETIDAGNVYYKWEGKDNIEIILNFTFDESVAAGLDPASEDFRKEIYSRLIKGAHFYHNEEEIEKTWGYWPQEAGINYADEMYIFYVVPSDHPAGSLRFTFDGNLLGKGAESIDIVVEPG